MLDLLCMSFLFFFFKQKTAYEMRISDWSSDVCSADLRALQHRDQLRDAGELATDQYRDPSGAGRSDAGADGTGRGAGHAQQGPQGISADPRLAGQHKPDSDHMAANPTEIEALVQNRKYAAGFVTDIESVSVPPGLSEDVVRLISAKKGEPEWLLEFRLKAYRRWLTMSEPRWAHVQYPQIDYQAISYYSTPKSMTDGPKSLDEVDPKLLETYAKLGIPLREQEMQIGRASCRERVWQYV